MWFLVAAGTTDTNMASSSISNHRSLWRALIQKMNYSLSWISSQGNPMVGQHVRGQNLSKLQSAGHHASLGTSHPAGSTSMTIVFAALGQCRSPLLLVRACRGAAVRTRSTQQRQAPLSRQAAVLPYLLAPSV